jgi:hypothetical protein
MKKLNLSRAQNERVRSPVIALITLIENSALRPSMIKRPQETNTCASDRGSIFNLYCLISSFSIFESSEAV